MKRKVTLPDRVEALCFAALGAAIAYAAVGGSYTTLTTPRSLPYLIIGAVLLFVLATAACSDCSTPRSVRFYGS